MRLYLYALVLAIVAFVAHLFGTYDGLYVTVDFYDIFMHLLVGFCLGLAIVAVSRSLGVESKKQIWIGAAVIVVFGVAWELFEAAYELAAAPVGTVPYYLDTTKDLFNDLFGAGVAFLLTNRKKINGPYGEMAPNHHE